MGGYTYLSALALWPVAEVSSGSEVEMPFAVMQIPLLATRIEEKLAADA
jgi:hypothetical protein